MIIFFSIIKLIVGLSLFFLGMQGVKDSFYKASGGKIEYLLKKLTDNIIISILTGILVTMLIQSSSATTVIIISLVNADLMSLKQAFGVIMGANIGTTITVQLISFSLQDYLWIIILIGIIFYVIHIISKKKKFKYIARGLLGFSILFIGLELLSNIVSGFQDFQLFIKLLSYLELRPLVGIIVGALITATIQSSSALTAIIVILAKANLITLPLAITLALGSNIGTCITAFFASVNSSKSARQTAWAHILFNSFGVLVVIPILGVFTKMIALTSSDIARQVANAHTIFNVFNTLIIIPIRGIIIKCIVKIN